MRGPTSPEVYPSEQIPAMVENSNFTLYAATVHFGEELMSDMQLGFSKPFDLRHNTSEMPTVKEFAGSIHEQHNPHMLSLVILYRQVTKRQGFILNIHPSAWPELYNNITTLCRYTKSTSFRVWTDQILSFRTPSAVLR